MDKQPSVKFPMQKQVFATVAQKVPKNRYQNYSMPVLSIAIDEFEK